MKVPATQISIFKPLPLFWILFLALSIFHLTQINKQPLQPWDEGFYAVRVKYIVETHHWLDQTAGSVNGLYSSSQPPLQIWLAAATAKITGLNLFSLRIWPLLFSLGTLVFVFFFFEDKKQGLFAAWFLGTIPFYMAFARLGQLDMAFVFFYTAGMFCWNKFVQKPRKYMLLLTGVIAGLAFMAKMWTGVLLLLSVGVHILYLVVTGQKHFKKALVEMIWISVPAFVIMLPWHLWMFARHGDDFLNYFFLFHVVERMLNGVEHNTQPLGILFYVNQLVVMLSALLVLLFFSKWKKRKLSSSEILLSIFFAVPFILFSISSTKLRTYTLPLLMPLSMLCAKAFVHLFENKKITWSLVVTSVFILIWSKSQIFRDGVQQLQFSDPKVLSRLALWVVVCIVVLAFKTPTSYFLNGLATILVFSFLNDKPIVYHQHKLNEVSDYYYDRDFDRLIYMDSRRTADDPLVTYFFNGINLHPSANYVMLCPEEHPDFELNHKNRNSFILINIYHRNKDYSVLENEIRNKAVLMYESEMYMGYIW